MDSKFVAIFRNLWADLTSLGNFFKMGSSPLELDLNLVPSGCFTWIGMCVVFEDTNLSFRKWDVHPVSSAAISFGWDLGWGRDKGE